MADLFLLISAHEDNDNNSTHVQTGDAVYATAVEAMAAADLIDPDGSDLIDVQYIVHLQVGHCCWYAERIRSLYYLDRDHSWRPWGTGYLEEPCSILGVPPRG